MTSQEGILPPPEIKYSSYHWGPFLFHTQVTPAECQMVLEEGKKCRKKSNDHRHHLAGHLKEEYRFSDPGPIAGWLKKYLLAYASAYKEWRNQPSPNLNFKLTTMWINYMKANDFNPEHIHKGMLTWIIYLKTPNLDEERKKYEGKSFAPGGVLFHYGEHSDPQWAEHSHGYLPMEGYMWIFPAMTRHEVIPFKSPGERISVSGNLYFIHPTKKSTAEPPTAGPDSKPEK